MAQLDFSYELEIAFSQPVNSHHFTLRCIPRSSLRQKIRYLHWELSPEGSLCSGMDSFGNCCLYGTRQAPHSCFRVLVTGQADTQGAVCIPAPPQYRLGPFRVPTKLTNPGPAITRLHDAGTPGDLMGYLSLLSQVMVYTPGSTTSATTAEEALTMGKGVCQDYSHILLALLRMDGIACRYVCGLMTGVGASHAWVEAATDGGWMAIDPTNHCAAGEDYLCLSVGRDAWDCQMNRGLYRGTALQSITVTARVEKGEWEP